MNITDINVPIICFVSFFLLVWFQTDLIETLATLTRLRSAFMLPEFEKHKLEKDAFCNYPSFLHEKYNNFLTKLISCEICSCFWLTLFGLGFLTLWLDLTWSFLMILFPINYITSLLLYLIIRKLL